MPSTQRLVVVSNRLPVTLKRAGDTWHTERSTGGLATAMNPILQQTGGIWIGWPGESGADDDQRRRLAEPEFGEWLANELAAMLEGMLADTELRVQRGRRNVEVKPAWANKGEVVELVLRSCADPDFRLAIGDDITDEDMFERLGPEAWTVRVEGGPTRARFSLPNVRSVRALLGNFVGLRRAGGA